jgi:hypothetical protein
MTTGDRDEAGVASGSAAWRVGFGFSFPQGDTLKKRSKNCGEDSYPTLRCRRFSIHGTVVELISG